MKSLLLLGSALSMLSSGVSAKSPQRNHVVEYDTYQVTYKYETNEINSFDDFILGNAYHIEISNTTADSVFNFDEEFTFLFFNVERLDLSLYERELDFDIDTCNLFDIDYYIYLHKQVSSYDFDLFACYCENGDSFLYNINSLNLSNDNFSLFGDFILYEMSSNEFLQAYDEYITKCDNIPIESVETITHNTSVLGFVYDFIYNTILDIPNIENYSFNVFGVNTSLKQYLTISICVVLAILLIALLLWFLRWVFRTFSGLLS